MREHGGNGETTNLGSETLGQTDESIVSAHEAIGRVREVLEMIFLIGGGVG